MGIDDIGWLLLGVVLGTIRRPIWVWLRNRADGGHRKIPVPNRRHVLTAIIGGAIIWSLWTTQNTQTETKAISGNIKEVQTRERDCYGQFYQAITVNRGLNEDIAEIEEKLSDLDDADNAALFRAVIASNNLPDNIKNLPQDHPLREQYKRDLTAVYIEVLTADDKKRTDLKAERAAKQRSRVPYPEPKCGRG